MLLVFGWCGAGARGVVDDVLAKSSKYGKRSECRNAGMEYFPTQTRGYLVPSPGFICSYYALLKKGQGMFRVCVGCGCGRGSHLLVSGPGLARLDSGLRVSNYVSHKPQSGVSVFEKDRGPCE